MIGPDDIEAEEEEVEEITEEITDIYYGKDSVVIYDNDGKQHCVPTKSWESDHSWGTNGC